MTTASALTPADVASLDDHALLVAALHYNGTLPRPPSDLDRQARLACDGMGDLTQHEWFQGESPEDRANFAAVLFDWSHVRDSTDEGMRRAANVLRKHYGVPELPGLTSVAMPRPRPKKEAPRKERSGLRVLPIANVYPNPNQPRKIFDERPLEELAKSIEETGLQSPIKVRPDGKGEYMIVYGERRYRAHMLLGLATIKAIVEDMSDEALADAAIIENLQRKDITQLEEARAFQRRLESGISVEDLARRLGIKQPHRITERIALLRLTPEYQDAFEKGLLTPTQAFEMSRLSHGYQRLLCEAIQKGRCKSAQELRVVAATLLEAQHRNTAAPARLVPLNTGATGVQPALFEQDGATEEERAVVTALEAKIQRVVDLLRGGIKDNQVVVVSRVSRANADVMADKLEVIEAQLRKLRLALRAAATITDAA